MWSLLRVRHPVAQERPVVAEGFATLATLVHFSPGVSVVGGVCVVSVVGFLICLKVISQLHHNVCPTANLSDDLRLFLYILNIGKWVFLPSRHKLLTLV